MKKLTLILTLIFCAGLFAQDSDLELLYRADDFEEDGGNLYASGIVPAYESAGVALKVSPAAPYTLDKTGAQIDVLHGGTFAELTLAGKLVHDGDADTYFEFAANNRIIIYAGNRAWIDMDAGALTFNNGGIALSTRFEASGVDTALLIGTDGKIYIEGLTNQSAGGLVLETDQETHEIYAETSTEKHKSNIRDAEVDSRDLLALELKSYTDNQSGTEQVGYIAEDMADVMPELVVYSGGEPLGIKYTKFSMVLLDLIKKQQAQIDALEKRVTTLENK